MKDRIQGLVYLKGKDVKPSPFNFRTHPQQQKDALNAAMGRLGVVAAGIVRKLEDGTYEAIDGHLRAAENQETELPWLLTDLDEQEAKEAILTIDPLSALAGTNAEILDAVLQSVDINDEALQNLCTKLADEAGLYKEEQEEADEDGKIEIPDVVVVKNGDIWILGTSPQHRFMCGDSTSKEDIDKLLAGNLPFMCVCDPPYSVKYDPSWRNEAAAKGLINFAARREGIVMNDDRVDWTDAYKLFPGDVLYVWHAGRHAGEVMRNVEDAGFEIRSQIIWKKPNFAISRGHYHWIHEPMVYSVRKGSTAKWCGDRSQSTVWEITNRLENGDETEHGTQKPVECMARPIRNHGDVNDDVMDIFAGVFTTGIACEQLGRRCFGIDLDPKWVQAGIQRWEKMTGKQAILEATGQTLSELLSQAE